MKCGNVCSDKFYKSPEPPSSEDVRRAYVPKCKDCGIPMKPHCMFFDQRYIEKWYKNETIMEFLNTKMDGLIVVGTAL